MKIICVGRNYKDHARELGNEVPSEPMLFLKPQTAILPKRNPFYIPDFTEDLHYEVELVLRICRLGKNIQTKFAHKYYSEIGVGIDFTARDLQEACKEKGQPWEIAKAFDNSAPIAPKFIPVADFDDLTNIDFRLEKNGEVVQKGNSGDQIFNFDELISHLSRFFTIKLGDLVFTGTPAGVGRVEIGDRLEAFIGDQSMLKVTVK